MKKVCIMLFAVLALSATCLGQAAPTNQPDSPRIKPPTASPTPAPAPGSVSSSSSSSTSSSLEETLIAREKAVWEAIKKKDLATFGGYLAEDMVYVNKDGVHSKADTVKGIEASPMPELTLDDWKVTIIDKDVALVTYRVNSKAVACGPEATSERNSTIWAERGGKWLAVFHQDTLAEPGK
ncbi:MAG TPA: nuclear transport factor 2 family protein [Pyrinomonadaceae bacterium]|jgi:hypothetical protein|nr:nuclear transport factor 2 family protein [Pyrinomonadaceae bacterium]